MNIGADRKTGGTSRKPGCLFEYDVYFEEVFK